MATAAKKSNLAAEKKSAPNQAAAKATLKSSFRASRDRRIAADAASMTANQLAAKYELTPKTIHQICQSAGVASALSSHHVPKVERNAEVVTAVLAGETYEAVGTLFGIKAAIDPQVAGDDSFIPQFLNTPKALPVDLFAMHPGLPPAVSLPPPLQVARCVNAHGREAAAERWPRVSATLIDRLLAEGRLMIADEQARLDAVDKEIREEVKVPGRKLAPAPAIGNPKPDFVAEVVGRHGLQGACELWPHIEADELDRLARIGARRIVAPSDSLPVHWAARLWNGLKRLVGRS